MYNKSIKNSSSTRLFMKKKSFEFKKIAYTSVATLAVLGFIYPALEPVLVQAVTDTVQVSLTVDAGITITSPIDVTMAPNLGVVANSSIGSSVWNVKTNDPDGYTLGVLAATTPALQQSGIDTFADYTEATPGTPDVWSVNASSKEFGYSAFGADVSTATWGTSASCGVAGVPAGAQKYDGFTASNSIVATKNATTTTSGVDTTVCYAAAQNGIYASSGVYVANITATATVQ